MELYRNKLKSIQEEISRVIIGKEAVIEKVMMCILAGGHILLEDIPGVGKTTLALSFSKAMLLDYQRVQFTPDVLPSDVVGFSVLNQNNELEYKPGAVLCNLFLADEINRTSPKTQAALLEVMEEGQVTVDGNTWKVPQPFIVMATQNPINSIGTQMLPESQLDRFMVKLSMGYPTREQEMCMLKQRHGANPIDNVQPVLNREQLKEIQEKVEQVFVHDAIYEYITNLVAETRNHHLIELGVSPRGTLALVSMAKACAFIEGRMYMVPEDVERVFVDVAAHRVVLSQRAKMAHAKEREILNELCKKVPKPQLKREA